MILALFPVTVFLVAGVVHYKALMCNDRVVEGLYRRHRDIWVRIGSPRGWSWRVPEARGFFLKPVITFRSAPPVWLEQAPELESDYLTGQRMNKILGYVFYPLFALALVITAIIGFQ
jgi:hypothetical protein